MDHLVLIRLEIREVGKAIVIEIWNRQRQRWELLDLHSNVYFPGADGTSGRFTDAFNPATGKLKSRVPLASQDEVQKAIAAAKAAFPKWWRGGCRTAVSPASRTPAPRRPPCLLA